MKTLDHDWVTTFFLVRTVTLAQLFQLSFMASATNSLSVHLKIKIKYDYKVHKEGLVNLPYHPDYINQILGIDGKKTPRHHL